MRITIIALGSRGDVQPYIVLGRGLRLAGHQVRVATFGDFAPLVLSAGLEFHLIHGDAKGLLQAASSAGMLDGKSNPIRFALALRRSYASLADSICRDLSDPQLSDTQLLLNQLPANLYGVDLAEKWGIPQAMLAVMPLSPTRHAPMMLFPTSLSWLPGYNAWTYRLAEQLAWLLFRSSINRWRQAALGLPSHPARGPFERMRIDRLSLIYGFSEKIVPRQPDWREHIHLTGWWLPSEPAWEAPAGLREFLDAGPAPVFLGFGSMPVPDPQRVTRVLVDAVQSIHQRAVLHTGWAGLGASHLPEEIFPIDYAPYGWMFPHMAMVVHHGGSGTTGFAFQSGVPSLVVPFTFDQFYWGRRFSQLGVGADPLPFKRLEAGALAARISQALNSPEMYANALALSAQLRAEDGIQKAVEIIQKLA